MAPNDVIFNMDPLWSDPHIDVVGIDNYLPLSDWRDGAQNLDADPVNGPTAIHRQDLPARGQRRGRRGLRLVLRERRRSASRRRARRSSTRPRARPGCSARRTSATGGPTPITAGRAACATRLPPAMSRRPSRSGSPSSAVPPSTRAPTSRTSSTTRSRRNRASALTSRSARRTTRSSAPISRPMLSYWRDHAPVSTVYRRPHAAGGEHVRLGLGRAALSGLSRRSTGVWHDTPNYELGHWLTGRVESRCR